MRPYDIVLLDADMTLLDFERSEWEALRRTLRQHGLDPTEEVVATYSKINQALWDAFARGEMDQDFLTVERFAALARVYGNSWDPRQVNRSYLNALGEAAFLLPGAMDFCLRLNHGGLTLAIATNGLPAAQRGRYVGTGLNRVIPHIFISMELGASKPRPEFFQRILEALSVTDLSRVVMVGDSLSSDVAGGNRAGIDTIWYNPRSLPLTGAAVPTYTAADYDQICSILLPGSVD